MQRLQRVRRVEVALDAPLGQLGRVALGDRNLLAGARHREVNAGDPRAAEHAAPGGRSARHVSRLDVVVLRTDHDRQAPERAVLLVDLLHRSAEAARVELVEHRVAHAVLGHLPDLTLDELRVGLPLGELLLLVVGLLDHELDADARPDDPDPAPGLRALLPQRAAGREVELRRIGLHGRVHVLTVEQANVHRPAGRHRAHLPARALLDLDGSGLERRLRREVDQLIGPEELALHALDQARVEQSRDVAVAGRVLELEQPGRRGRGTLGRPDRRVADDPRLIVDGLHERGRTYHRAARPARNRPLRTRSFWVASTTRAPWSGLERVRDQADHVRGWTLLRRKGAVASPRPVVLLRRIRTTSDGADVGVVLAGLWPGLRR